MKKSPKVHRQVNDFSLLDDFNVATFVESLCSALASTERGHTSWRDAYLMDSVLEKFVSSDTAPALVRRARALNKWLGAERNNQATNVRLAMVDPEYQILPGVEWSDYIEWTRELIASVIGDTVPLSALTGQFSGGATTSRKRTESHPASKYVGKADVTLRAWDYANLQLEECYLMREVRVPDSIRVVEGNVFFTVPKSTDIDRCACKEPDINMFLQRGAGLYIRTSLKRFGIDLQNQNRNQNLAQLGSLNGNLATLDLSSASDSISRELVALLLPICWYTHLDAIRSHITIIDGNKHELEMFSSMGNGFTFELESLLFWALAKATARFTGTKGNISVYGDDIIVPVTMYPDLTIVLSFMGFEVNTKKSFHEGPFRESCGGHYYNGRPVTPFYIKETPTNVVDAIHLANQLRKWLSNEFGQVSCLDPAMFNLWLDIAALVPPVYWGGHDLDDASRLVSLWAPKRAFRITERTKSVPNDLAEYVFWHATKERNPDSPVTTTGIPKGRRKLVKTRVRWDYRRTISYFPQEVETTDCPVEFRARS